MMNKKNMLMIAFKILLASSLLFIYRYIFVLLQDKDPDFQQIAIINWVDALFLIIAYTIVSIFILIKEKKINIFIKWLLILIVYALAFSIVAFPYMFVSFLQPIKTNSLVHFLLVLVLFDLIFRINSVKKPAPN